MNLYRATSIFLSVVFWGCSHTSTSPIQGEFKISQKSIAPGSEVLLGGKKNKLHAGNIQVGDRLDASLEDFKSDGRVTIVIVVPSVDTPVCEVQTHELGESPLIPPTMRRVTVSRDLPMAQARFAKEAKLTNVEYFSDYKFSTFGKKSGLLIQGPELLARAVLVLDKQGVIRHLQIVPDVTELPDLAKAVEVAKTL